MVSTLVGGFSYPTGVACGTSGVLFVSDQANNMIRQVSTAGLFFIVVLLQYLIANNVSYFQGWFRLWLVILEHLRLSATEWAPVLDSTLPLESLSLLLGTSL